MHQSTGATIQQPRTAHQLQTSAALECQKSLRSSGSPDKPSAHLPARRPLNRPTETDPRPSTQAAPSFPVPHRPIAPPAEPVDRQQFATFRFLPAFDTDRRRHDRAFLIRNRRYSRRYGKRFGAAVLPYRHRSRPRAIAPNINPADRPTGSRWNVAPDEQFPIRDRQQHFGFVGRGYVEPVGQEARFES